MIRFFRLLLLVSTAPFFEGFVSARETPFAEVTIPDSWPKTAIFAQTTANTFTTVSSKPLRTRGQTMELSETTTINGIVVRVVEAPAAGGAIELRLRYGTTAKGYAVKLPPALKQDDLLQIHFPALAVRPGIFEFLLTPSGSKPLTLKLGQGPGGIPGSGLLVGDEERMLPEKSLSFALLGEGKSLALKRPKTTSTELTGFKLADPALEITVWAESPLLYNPTNIDTDAAGRLWVTEAVNYRRTHTRKKGDRVVVLSDTDLDGRADTSSVFVEDPAIVAPMGIAVIDNRVYVSQTPEIVVYTDVNRNQVFDRGDLREVLLDGFVGQNHDHSTHSVIGGPDGNLYFNQGNCGANLTDRDGRNFLVGSHYYNKGGPFVDWGVNPTRWAGKPSADGHVWVSGFTGRIRPDGSGLAVVGHGYRNSYEQTLSSFGDVFQNDNDDPPACRTSFVPEGAFFGYCSEDGKFGWSADRIAGQSIPDAQWRTHLPGTFPPGDVYGSGSPTGITFYENGALPDTYAGSLFSCEPARRSVFRYQPEARGATFKLEREVFIQRAGGSSSQGAFSDVSVSPDGVLYLADWFDPMVGGHGARDSQHIGKIYRVAPRGYQPKLPNTETSVDLLGSPAHNVRFAGFEQLQAKGPSAIPQLFEILIHPDPWVAARAIWLLPATGEPGVAKLMELSRHPDARFRVAALRAGMRNGSPELGLQLARAMGNDASPQVQRTMLTHLRNTPYPEKKDLLLKLASTADFEDRTLLEAFGLAVDGAEGQFWSDWAKARGIQSAIDWKRRDHLIVWRLHPSSLLAHMVDRICMTSLPLEHREALIPSLAMNTSQAACDAMKQVWRTVEEPSLKDLAKQFLVKGMHHRWKATDVRAFLVKTNILDPNPQPIVPVAAPKNQVGNLNVARVLKLTGDAAKGKVAIARCYTCHAFEGVGASFGPDLKGWGQQRSAGEIAIALIKPSAGIAHGYEGHAVTLEPTKERPGFAKVHGILVSDSEPLTIRSAGGLEQQIPSSRIHFHRPFAGSLMLSASQLGMSEQDVADVVAYLQAYR